MSAGEQGSASPYAELRWANKPDPVRFLLIGESPPDPEDGPIRFFYSPEFRPPENLYVGVVEALLGGAFDVRDKPACLAELRRRGWWLLDATDEPVNHRTKRERRAAVRRGFEELRGLLRDPQVRPSVGVVICKASVYKQLANPIRSLGLVVLHDRRIRFPTPLHREHFIGMLREIAEKYGG